MSSLFEIEMRFADGKVSFFRMRANGMAEALSDLAKRYSASLSRALTVQVRAAA